MTETDKLDIKSMTLSELENALAQYGQPRFRTEQVFKWLRGGCDDFDQMTNLPKAFREILRNNFEIFSCKIKKRLVSAIDNTVKYLYELNDGECIESVLMEYKHGYTLCISTQVGCRMGCRFCASTIGGKVRDLLPSEMLSQIQTASNDRGVRISNVVMMGIGEPLDNFDNVMRFLELVGNQDGLGIGMRHISLSTSGHVEGIYKLMRRRLQLTLSVSLHAPNDEIRSQLMPVNRRWNISKLMEACRDYIAATNRRISFEYAMIDGVNDTPLCAEQLGRLLRGLLCHINLIPVNNVAERDFRSSTLERQRDFIKILEKYGHTVTVRRTLGSDINASCGQLRRESDKASVAK